MIPIKAKQCFTLTARADPHYAIHLLAWYNATKIQEEGLDTFEHKSL